MDSPYHTSSTADLHEIPRRRGSKRPRSYHKPDSIWYSEPEEIVTQEQLDYDAERDAWQDWYYNDCTESLEAP